MHRSINLVLSILRFRESQYVVGARILLIGAKAEMRLQIGPGHIFNRFCFRNVFADSRARPEAKLAAGLAIGEMFLLEVVHGRIGIILIELALAWHSSLIAIPNRLFKTLRVSEVSALILVLKGDSRRFVVKVSFFGHVFSKVS